MELAAIILSIISILMSGTVLVIYLAKHVFSSHVIQMVPADTIPTQTASSPQIDEFTEFDAPSMMDVAAEAAAKKKGI